MDNFIDVLVKDVTGENEGRRVSYMIRFNALLMCFYFMCWMSVFTFYRMSVAIIISAMALVANMVAVEMTYQKRNGPARIVFAAVLCAWMAYFVAWWGWECGVQHFVFVLITLAFAGTYVSDFGKILLSIGVFILRMLLYIWHMSHEPVEHLARTVSIIFQMINIITIFVSIVIILFLFTHDKMETEAKLARYNAKLMDQAGHDHLTRLPNRTKALAYLSEMILGGEITRGVSVAIGDIDYFKKINDTYGHDAGDAVLRFLASTFSSFMKDHGMAVRWGGEEFLFIFKNENLDDAAYLLNKLLDKIRFSHIEWNDLDLQVTMTFGVTDMEIPMDADLTPQAVQASIDEAITFADKKLYMGKAKGRNMIIM
ncbi:GGDEF domain-containing protein [Butyrivibrio sp. MC2013]|uniref:GGDEF domain-containing protein n=1 Tax=Butyrivibrio sp. MC2013 TaxID=1280686 RepID=UPI0004172EA5|nr:GGDEF domain-containing protein [Butyrivibrio sp. MC2013]